MNAISSNTIRVDNPGRAARVVIVGGGPGGLFSAWHLASKAGTACDITILEASDRVGGKILTSSFAGSGRYEAGVAEIYDYSHLGPDPLRDLIEKELGLEIKHIQGGPCVLDGQIFLDADALLKPFGGNTVEEVHAFRQKCADLLNQGAFYKAERFADNAHPWAQRTAEEVIDAEMQDEQARRYIRVMSHSDVAAPTHLTNGLNLLKNVLMDVDGYLNVFSVVGGNEGIVERLVDELDANIRLNCAVQSVQPLQDGGYKVVVNASGQHETIEADYVIIALPLSALSVIEWRSNRLQEAMVKHIGYFDRPGHYLRATLLFERPFWREYLPEDWWMSDAFGGCCVYDEGARHDFGSWGALGFLIAGNAALSLANVSDDVIEAMCLNSLPDELQHFRNLIVDRRVHRWMASVNAIPGGYPVRSRAENHRPDPERLPGFFMVGDYMFDATLNGVLDSADAATDFLVADVLAKRRTQREEMFETIGFDAWSPGFSERALSNFFQADFLRDIAEITWGLKPGARILHVGAGSGLLVRALRALGYDAWGFEQNRLQHSRTADDVRAFSKFGDMLKLPFEDKSFDLVIETSLAHIDREAASGAIAEIKRVTRRGLILGSVVTDLTIDVIERYDFLQGVRNIASRWDWSEALYAHGFEHSLADQVKLDAAWARAVSAGAGPGHWYEDAESLLFCIYQLPESQVIPTAVTSDDALPSIVPQPKELRQNVAALATH